MTAGSLEVTGRASDLGLLSIDELRKAAGVTGSAADGDLRELGLRVAARIARHCKIPAAGGAAPTLRQETLIETFRLTRGDGPRNFLYLARRPVLSIADVIEAGSALETEVSYEVEAATGKLIRLDGGEAPRAWCYGVVAVTYDGGFASVPDDLKWAASELVRRFFSRQGRDPAVRSISIPGVVDRQYWIGAASDPNIPADIADALDPYTRKIFA